MCGGDVWGECVGGMCVGDGFGAQRKHLRLESSGADPARHQPCFREPGRG